MNIDSKKIRSLCIDVKNWRISHAVSHDAMKCIKGPWVILEGQTDCRFAPARTAELNIAEDDETQTERGLGIIEHFSTESGEPAFMGAQVGLTQQQFASLLKDVESLAPSDTLKFVVCLDLMVLRLV